jgi:hypothetical protein
MDTRYTIEAENFDGTFETVASAGIWSEAEHELRKAALREGMRPQGPRPLSLGDCLNGVIAASWHPA